MGKNCVLLLFLHLFRGCILYLKVLVAGVFSYVTESIIRAAFNGVERQLKQSKEKENLCCHLVPTRWPVNADFNNTLIIGVRASLAHFVLCEQERHRGVRQLNVVRILCTKILIKYE